MLGLHIVGVEIGLAVLGHPVEGEHQGRFLDVGVVARTPVDGGQGRILAIPLAARGGRRQLQALLDIGAVALHLVEAAEGIVAVGDPEQIVRHPAVVVAVGEDAGDAALGHLGDLGAGQQPPFLRLDGVERRVVGPCPGGDVEVGLRLVQVVQDGGMPLQHARGDVLGQLQVLAHAVAVVVVGDVLAPVDQGRLRFAGLLAVVVGVDDLLAAIDLDDRGDEGDDVLADVLDEGSLLHRQAVGELDQHLRPAGLRRVDAAGDPVDRLGGLDDRLGLLRRRPARIAQGGELGLVLVEVLEVGLVADGDDHLVAAFLGLADHPELHPGRGLGQLLVVALDVLGVGQLSGRAGNAAEELQRRRHGVRRRHMVDKLGGEARVDQVLLDERAIGLVLFLSGRVGGVRRAARQREQARARQGIQDLHDGPPFSLAPGRLQGSGAKARP